MRFGTLVYGPIRGYLHEVPVQATCHFILFIYFCVWFFFFFFISWRLITLQYCSGFCHTLT